MGIIYSFNRGLGRASSGVEYAQSYRAGLFRRLKLPARFVFTDFFPVENLEHYARNLGFLDEEVIWLYSYFTDFGTEPTTYTREMLEATFEEPPLNVNQGKSLVRYSFSKSFYLEARLVPGRENAVEWAEYFLNGQMTRRDFFTSGRLFSEFYAPLSSDPEGETKTGLFLRTFYNRDGSEALSEVVGERDSLFRVRGEILDSKERFLEYFIRSLDLDETDVVLLDRSTDIGQAVLRAHGRASLGCVVHAEHYSPDALGQGRLLWNNFYEYALTNAEAFDFFICSTQGQSDLLKKHLLQVKKQCPRVVTIPVGSLDELSLPGVERRPFSLCTCSRLAPEKHVDYLVGAVALAREQVPEIRLDIYGTGSEEGAVKAAMERYGATDYVRLMGHRDLSGVYEQYSAYASASTSEGFGLTLMEAAGSGLPLVGFDVPYGNRAFIEDGGNGYLAPCPAGVEPSALIQSLSDTLVKLFTQGDLSAFSERSYEIAQGYLTGEVMKKWESLMEDLRK